MESLDWTKLAGDIVPETGRIPYEPNKHLFRKVAFDVFQLNSSPVESLWSLEDGEDGTQFLVAQYSDEDKEVIESKSHWEALSDRDGKNVTLMYKTAPIQRFASTDHGFSGDDVHLFQQTLVEKLGSDESFVSKLLKSQPKVKLDLLVSQFPELQALSANVYEERGEDVPLDAHSPGELIGQPDDPEQYEEYERGLEGETDIEDIKIEAMHMAARAIRQVDKFDRLERKDIEEIINSLAEELDAV